jgi:hypothetical protein
MELINYLDKHLPTEITDIIYKHHHKNIMKQITEILTHKIVFILVRDDNVFKLSFLVCENQRFEYSPNIMDSLYSKC